MERFWGLKVSKYMEKLKYVSKKKPCMCVTFSDYYKYAMAGWTLHVTLAYVIQCCFPHADISYDIYSTHALYTIHVRGMTDP